MPKGTRKAARRKSGYIDKEPSLDIRHLRAHIRDVAKTLAKPTTQKAVGYVRVSTDKQADKGGSPTVQRDRIADFCTLRRFDLVAVYDDAKSGAKDERKRPGLNAALEAIADKHASVLVVPDIDRLARDSDLIGFLRVTVERAGGTLLVIADEGEPEESRLLRQLLAQLERNRIRARMRVWSAARRNKGLPMGFAPFGLRKGANGRLEAEPAEKPIVARILAAKAKGAALRTIAANLNADAVPTRSGKAWNAMTVSNIVKKAGK
jgi:site-specific DNA recombinase